VSQPVLVTEKLTLAKAGRRKLAFVYDISAAYEARCHRPLDIVYYNTADGSPLYL
jgi:hypothetical protein